MDGKSKSSDLCDIRDASFSYLTTAQQNYVFKLTESAHVSHPNVIISSQDTSMPVNLERPNKAEEGEISVFGAEKCFNMKLDDGSRGIIDGNAADFVYDTIDKGVDHHRMRSKARFGTPSVSSESSWNRQTVLLPSNRRNSSHSSRQTKKVNERWFFPGFSCNACSDDKSVYVDKSVARRGHQLARNPIMLEGRKLSQSRFQAKDEFGSSSGFENMSIGSKRDGYLVLPTVNSGVQNLAVKREKQKILQEEDPRKSLDVFGSHVIQKEDIASNLERKLSVLTWDAIPFPKAQNLPTNSASSQIYEDPESDASSDLFEIENISCSTQPIFTKQNYDGMSGCKTPISRYEPSETSIEWSVVTASAADFSFISDYDDKNYAVTGKNSAALASPPCSRRGNSLLGCKSQKAVDVAETAYKKNEKPKSDFHHQRKSLDSSIPVRKLPADSKVKDFNFP